MNERASSTEAADFTPVQVPIDSLFDQLPKVVVAHLTFQQALSGPPSEGSMSYPIQSFLRVKQRSSWASVEAEVDHPALKAGKNLGRPRQIDFVGIARGRSRNKEDAPKLAFALEAKLHLGGDWGRVVRDLVKLLLLADHKPSEGAARYLLLAFPIPVDTRAVAKRHAEIISTSNGERVRLNQTIWIPKQSRNLFDLLLPWEIPKLRIRLGNLPTVVQSRIRTELKDLGKTSVRGDIEIRRIGFDWSDDFACGIWSLHPKEKKWFELPHP